ncbi:glycosyltransferase [Micromonospora sp. M12]
MAQRVRPAPAGRCLPRARRPLRHPVRPADDLHPERREPGPTGAGPADRVPVRPDPGGYLLLVGRLVPEKAADLLIRAFRRVDTGRRLAIVGGSSFTDEFVDRLRREAAGDERIVFTGFAYGDLLAELYASAAGFVQPSRLEGLPLTLLEAAAYGLPVVASDIAPHVEVLESDAAGDGCSATATRTTWSGC